MLVRWNVSHLRAGTTTSAGYSVGNLVPCSGNAMSTQQEQDSWLREPAQLVAVSWHPQSPAFSLGGDPGFIFSLGS